jgi:MerR family transcriptional regulator, thiopeptide resistance regulator
MSRDRWRVGELAQRAGLTVRTLHHWDEIGLLSPSMRSEAGHRWYGEADVARLQQILSLRQLGLGLERIREALDRAARGGDDLTPLVLVRRHLEHLRALLQQQQRLCRRLEALERRFAARPATIEDLLDNLDLCRS